MNVCIYIYIYTHLSVYLYAHLLVERVAAELRVVLQEVPHQGGAEGVLHKKCICITLSLSIYINNIYINIYIYIYKYTCKQIHN